MENLHYIIAAKKERAARERKENDESAGEIRARITWQYFCNHGYYHYNAEDADKVEWLIIQEQLAAREAKEKKP